MDCKSSIKNDVIKFCDLTRKGFFCLHDLQIFLFKNVPALIISYMKNRYLHLMLSGSFAAEESLTLKINWLDPDFLVEDGMVVSDGSPHGKLTIPPFPSKTQVFVIVKIEITKTDNIWWFLSEYCIFYNGDMILLKRHCLFLGIIYTSLNTTSMQNQFSSIF